MKYGKARKLIVMSLVLITALSFPVMAKDYKKLMGKKITVTEEEEAYAVTDQEQTYTFEKCKVKMYVTSSDGLHLRKAPTTRSKSVKTLKWGKRVTVIGRASGKANRWVLVRHKGKYRFLWGKHLSKKKPKRKYLGKFSITAYCYDGTRSADGSWPRTKHTVACNSLPLGTKVYIQGVGTRVVEDRGASWHSDHWMDLYLSSESACEKWGVRKRKVWRIKK